jgi:NADPH:quinone reductase-like Zn-dependent oxidoreductase
MTGIVSGKWSLDRFNPMEVIPTAVGLTVYGGGPKEFMATPLNELAELIASGKMKVPVGKVFHIDQIVEAHEMMDANTAGGKIVVLT